MCAVCVGAPWPRGHKNATRISPGNRYTPCAAAHNTPGRLTYTERAYTTAEALPRPLPSRTAHGTRRARSRAPTERAGRGWLARARARARAGAGPRWRRSSSSRAAGRTRRATCASLLGARCTRAAWRPARGEGGRSPNAVSAGAERPGRSAPTPWARPAWRGRRMRLAEAAGKILQGCGRPQWVWEQPEFWWLMTAHLCVPRGSSRQF